MVKILILGGTNFIGRNLVESLMDQKEIAITLFNRGITNSSLFPGIKTIFGDRNSADIQAVAVENWDYVIDLSCYFPDSITAILPQLNSTLKRYILISSCSVYDNETNQSVLRNEDAATLSCTEKEGKDRSDETYGRRKAESERILIKSGVPCTILRPALVYGRYDPTDRLYYWLYHLKHESKLLFPNQGKNFFSMTYVNDLVRSIILAMNETSNAEIYTIITRPKASLDQLVSSTAQLMKKVPNLVDVDSIFLKQHQLREWVDLPLWLDCNYYTYDNKKSLENLKLEPTDFDQSLLATIDYYEKQGWKQPNYGLSDQRREACANLAK